VNIPAYLERINYNGSILPDLETLQGLHISHLQNIPFENLDIGSKHRTAIKFAKW